MIKTTTKKEDAQRFIGKELIQDLEDGRYNGDIIKTLKYIQRMLDNIQSMPRDDIGEKAKSAACYASANIGGAIELCREATEARQKADGYTA